MPYVPSRNETRRLRAALDRASFSEAERIMWLLAFAGLLALDGIIVGAARTWRAAVVGALGALGGFALLYWRLRGGWLSDTDRELHGIGLRTQQQRAYTALMLRQVLTGRNALAPKQDHDPYAAWLQRTEAARSGEEVQVAPEE
jgi:hypothetical protein